MIARPAFDVLAACRRENQAENTKAIKDALPLSLPEDERYGDSPLSCAKTYIIFKVNELKCIWHETVLVVAVLSVPRTFLLPELVKL